MGALEKALSGATTREERTTLTGSIQRQKLWVNFHSHMVNRFGIDLDHLSEIKENLSSFIQRVNQTLYESLISRSLPPLSSSSQPQPRTILSADELNTV